MVLLEILNLDIARLVCHIVGQYVIAGAIPETVRYPVHSLKQFFPASLPQPVLFKAEDPLFTIRPSRRLASSRAAKSLLRGSRTRGATDWSCATGSITGASTTAARSCCSAGAFTSSSASTTRRTKSPLSRTNFLRDHMKHELAVPSRLVARDEGQV